MTLLDKIINKTTPSAPKGIIYGPPGSGKSTFGASAGNSLIIDCENGAGAIACKRTPSLATWPEILSWLQVVECEEHPYETIVIDSVDWLIRRVEEHVSGCASGKTDATVLRGRYRCIADPPWKDTGTPLGRLQYRAGDAGVQVARQSGACAR